MLRWYLIHTKASAEAVAVENLERQGYEVYLPRLIQVARRRAHWHERTVPLFPRYLFLRLRENFQALSPVRSSVGVTNVVRFGSQYAIVPNAVIEDLRARADPESGLHRLNTAEWVPGARVRIVGGPLSGLDAVFEREAGDARVIVLLGLLGQEAAVGISASFVELARAV